MRTFFDISEELDVLLAEKKCQEVLNLLDTIQEYLSEEEFIQSEFARQVYQANAMTLLEKWEDVMILLKKGNASGYAFPLHWNFFAELENYSEFANIKKANEEVIQKAKEEAKYEYEVILPEGYDRRQKYPLFFCLHGDGFCCNKKEQMYYWKTDSIRNKGFIVVYPQSSQIYFSDSFGWLIDPQKAREDMADLYQEMKAKYSIDEDKVIVAGFSGGATAVVDLAVHNVFPIKGVIALCAGDYLEEETLKDILEMAKRGTKLIFYEASEAKEPTLAPFLQRLKETGNHYEYHLMEGMGHWYPADIEEKSLKAIDFFNIWGCK